MKTTKLCEIEIQRSNVTPAQFLSYVRRSVDKKGADGIRSDLDLAYFVRGDDLNFDTHHDGLHEISVSKPYQMQTFIRDDETGAVYNEICEFDFWDEKTGFGYYYLLNVIAEDDPEATTETTTNNNNDEAKEGETMNAEKYDYLTAMTDDVKTYINDNIDLSEYIGRRDDLEERLNEECWIADGVTGNASGSYYCNAWKAEEALCHNLDLLGEAVAEFGGDADVLKNGAEYCDVTIRCYLLGQAIAAALDNLSEELGAE